MTVNPHRAALPRRSLRAACIMLLTVCVVASCGLPGGGPPRAVDSSQLPPGLRSDGPASATDDPETDPRRGGPREFWLDDKDRLVSAEPTGQGGVSTRKLGELLTDLANGPTDALRASGLGTALGPDSDLDIVTVTDYVAVIDVDLGVASTEPRPAAVGGGSDRAHSHLRARRRAGAAQPGRTADRGSAPRRCADRGTPLGGPVPVTGVGFVAGQLLHEIANRTQARCNVDGRWWNVEKPVHMPNRSRQGSES